MRSREPPEVQGRHPPPGSTIPVPGAMTTDDFDPFGLDDVDVDDGGVVEATPASSAAASFAEGGGGRSRSGASRFGSGIADFDAGTSIVDTPPSGVLTTNDSSTASDWGAEPQQLQPLFTPSADEWGTFDPFGLTSARNESPSAAAVGDNPAAGSFGNISPPPEVSRIHRQAAPSPPAPLGESAGSAFVAAAPSSAATSAPFRSIQIGSESRGAQAPPFPPPSPPQFDFAFQAGAFDDGADGWSVPAFVPDGEGDVPSSSAFGTSAAPANPLPPPPPPPPPASVLIPPKMVVKLSVHEEVASVALTGVAACEGASNVSVEGTVLAQVQCSDANRNAPFLIAASLSPPPPPSSSSSSPPQRQRSASFEFSFLPDHKLSHAAPGTATDKSTAHPNASSNPTTAMIVRVPKEEIGFVPVGNYVVQEQVPHMPILLERKVTIHKTSVRIAVQVRSKLSNAGDVEDLTIAVAIPEHVDGRTVRVKRGEGAWDDLKRIVRWRLGALRRGESYMVTAEAQLWKPADAETEIHFPVLLRCAAASDPVSTVDLAARPADGHPSSITFSVTTASRILHRLP